MSREITSDLWWERGPVLLNSSCQDCAARIHGTKMMSRRSLYPYRLQE